MTIETLQMLSLISYVIAGILFVTGVLLFFLLKVPKLYGDISGRTARKAIEAIRRQNESTGDKAYKSSAVNMERGKITDKITRSGRVVRSPGGSGIGVATEELPPAAPAPQASETTVLAPANETTVLAQPPAGETTVLAQPASCETTVLDVPVPITGSEEFELCVEMGFTASREIIQ